jgi:hypothetical protein
VVPAWRGKSREEVKIRLMVMVVKMGSRKEAALNVTGEA